MAIELISLKNISSKSKILLVEQLGYTSNGEFIFDGQGNKVIGRYIEIPVRLDSMVILPGSTIILDDNELSISSYIEEFGNVF